MQINLSEPAHVRYPRCPIIVGLSASSSLTISFLAFTTHLLSGCRHWAERTGGNDRISLESVHAQEFCATLHLAVCSQWTQINLPEPAAVRYPRCPIIVGLSASSSLTISFLAFTTHLLSGCRNWAEETETTGPAVRRPSSGYVVCCAGLHRGRPRANGRALPVVPNHRWLERLEFPDGQLLDLHNSPSFRLQALG
jgi:hypothetical protein